MTVLKDLIDFLQNGGRLEKPSFMPDPVSTLMTQCWESDSKTRPTFPYLEIELSKLLEDELRKNHSLKVNNS